MLPRNIFSPHQSEIDHPGANRIIGHPIDNYEAAGSLISPKGVKGDRLVETKIANPWGLHHMHGNAEEWVQDWYGATYYEDAPERDPQGPAKGFSRVLRGGNYSDPAEDVQSSYRNAARPDFLSSFYGMRILARENLRTQIDQRSWGQVKQAAP